MTSPAEYVDPFHGNGQVATPVPQGIAAAWNWEKAQVGNTHPGATRPFGMVSALPYSGAYPTGYGLYVASYSGPPTKLFDRKTCTGVTHFHPSGTGNVEFFYNYLKVMPLESLDHRGARWSLVDEEASPGYYAATLAESRVRLELAAGRKAAFHRYTFPRRGPATLAVELSAAGVGLPGQPEFGTVPERLEAALANDGAVSGLLVAGGFTIYFCMVTDLPAPRGGFWYGSEVLSERTELACMPGRAVPPRGIGVALTAGRPVERVELRIAFSFRSREQARRNLDEIGSISFDRARQDALDDWNDHLSRIEVPGEDDRARSLFYSCLYHSLVKPADCGDESPFWRGDEPFFTDFVTMWDQHKTQLPLVMAVYRERGARIAASMVAFMKAFGWFPNGYIMNDRLERFEDQSSGLAWMTLYDAWVRGLGSVNWAEAAAYSRYVLERPWGKEFAASGRVSRNSHTLDLAAACRAIARIASAEGDAATAAQMGRYGGLWRSAYDPATGLLRADSDYYEGTLWNYSFRPHPDMADRIGLFASPEAFADALDTFFGYHDVADGTVDPHPTSATFERRKRRDRFEGLNNESDMESPYAYCFAGRHDRTCEVVRSVMRYQFTVGDGGLPGNDDSGGLSSWYVWNALGLFPLSGQDSYIIGSPLFVESTVRFGRGTLRILARDSSDANIYVAAATLNGKPLRTCLVPIDEIEAGGTLELDMSPAPTAALR